MTLRTIAFLWIATGVVVASTALVALPAKATAGPPLSTDGDTDLDPGGDGAHPVCSHYTYEFAGFVDIGISQEVAKLFSNDPEFAPGNVSTAEAKSIFADRCGFVPTNETLAFAATDFGFLTPPERTTAWNSVWFSKLAGSGMWSRNTSFVPGGAETTDNGWIKDAHATLFGLSPSTKLRVTYEDTYGVGVDRNYTYYYTADTVVRGVADYRIEVPSDDTTGPTRTEYEVVDVEFEQCVRSEIPVNWPRCHDPSRWIGTMSHSHSISVRIGDANVSELQYAAYINVTGTVTDKTCTEWNGSASRCDGSWNSSTERRSYAEVVYENRRNLRRARPANVTVRAARFPDGTYEVEVQSRERFATLNFSDRSGVHWKYMFYGRMAPYWEDATVRTGNGTEEPPYHYHPLSAEAVPTGFGPAVKGKASMGVVTRRSYRNRSITGPLLTSRIDVDVPEEYRRPRKVLVTGVREFDRSAVRLRGMVAGVTATAASPNLTVKPVQQVRPSNLSYEPVSRTEDRAVVRVTLTGPEGRPIETASRNGTIVFGNRTIETNRSGVALVRTNQSLVSFRYEPAAWYNTSASTRPYLESRAGGYVGKSRNVISEQVLLLGQFLALFGLPVMVALWFAKVATGADDWLPWEVID